MKPECDHGDGAGDEKAVEHVSPERWRREDILEILQGPMLRKKVGTKGLASWLERGANHPYQRTNRQNGENSREAEKQNRSQASKDVSRRPHRVSLSGWFSHRHGLREMESSSLGNREKNERY